MQDDSLNPDLARQLREALGMAKKEMKELYAMGSLYSKSLTGSVDAASRSNFVLGQQNGLVTSLTKSMEKMNKNSKEYLQLQNLTNQVQETANELAASRNRTMADLVLKQTMLNTGLTDEYAEQAKNLKLLLDQGAITEGIYNMHVKRLQEEQKHVNHLKEEVELQEQIAESILEIREEAESWKKSFTKIFETAKAIARDPAVLGAFMLKEGIERIEHAHESFEAFKEQGLSAGQAIEAQFKRLSLASMLGLSDTKDVMNGIIAQYGNVNALSKDTVNQLGKMAVHFDISGKEAAKLNASLSQIPGETAESAANAMEHTGHMAELQGIAPGKIMKDMAANTGEMARYAGKGAEGFGKSAIELHKMGVEIGTASKLADSLLNFESSINDQMEASVLLGREINLDKARELALNNDLEGMTKEIAKNIGGAGEFAKMNRLQQDALAKSVGMSTEELAKMMDAQQESNKYFGEGSSMAENALGYMMEYGGKAAGFFKENGMLLLTTLQFLTSENALKIKQYAMDTAHWAKEKAHMLWKKAQSALGMGKGVVGAAAGQLPKGVEAMSGAAGAASKVPAGAGKSTSGLTKAIEKINPGKLLAGAAALVLVAAAVFVFAKAAQEFADVSWESIGKAIVGMLALVGALVLIGAIMMSGVGEVAILAGAGAMLIMAAALFVLGKAIQEMAKGFDMFVPALLQLAPMAVDIVVLGAGLSLMGVGLIALGVASYIAAPGLMLAAFGLGLIVPSALVLSGLVQTGALTLLGESFMTMAASAPGLLQVGAALLAIGGGLTMVAIAGLLALPLLEALVALAVVAPALAAVGNALGGMFGGGGGEESDKMDTLIAKIDQLIAVASQGGEIKMDGKKVGDVIRLGLNSSGIR